MDTDAAEMNEALYADGATCRSKPSRTVHGHGVDLLWVSIRGSNGTMDYRVTALDRPAHIVV